MKHGAPRFQAYLRRLWNVVGPVDLDVATQVTPIVDVQSPLPEAFRHRDERLCGAVLENTSAAGTVCRHWIASTSNDLLVVVEGVIVTLSVAGTIQFAITTNTPPAQAGGKAVADVRWTASQPPLLRTSMDTPAASSGANLAGFPVAAGVPFFHPLRTVLVNGFALEVARNVVGVATLTTSWILRERTIEPAER